MSVDYNPKQNEYKGLEHFRVWCQKVLPLVYDDSLSYYELLNKVVSYLNDVIDNTSKMGEDVSHMFDTYKMLLDWINSYFDNLSVQGEINNKLDIMANDGSLSSLIQPIFDTYKREIDNVVGGVSDLILAQNDVLATIESRISSFNQLAEGSTTGDAELIDTRIAYGGKTYETSGDAIRGQVQEIYSNLEKVIGEDVADNIKVKKWSAGHGVDLVKTDDSFSITATSTDILVGGYEQGSYKPLDLASISKVIKVRGGEIYEMSYETSGGTPNIYYEYYDVGGNSILHGEVFSNSMRFFVPVNARYLNVNIHLLDVVAGTRYTVSNIKFNIRHNLLDKVDRLTNISYDFKVDDKVKVYKDNVLAEVVASDNLRHKNIKRYGGDTLNLGCLVGGFESKLLSTTEEIGISIQSNVDGGIFEIYISPVATDWGTKLYTIKNVNVKQGLNYYFIPVNEIGASTNYYIWVYLSDKCDYDCEYRFGYWFIESDTPSYVNYAKKCDYVGEYTADNIKELFDDYGDVSRFVWNAVGDSITENGLYMKSVANIIGITYNNLGLASSTLAINNAYMNDKSIVECVCGLNGNSGYSDADVWTIMGGLNDCLYKSKLGKLVETGYTFDLSTVYGALQSMCEYILNLREHPRLILLTPTQSIRDSWGGTQYPTTMFDIRKAIVDVGEYYSLPVVDLWGSSGVNKFNIQKASNPTTRDGVHLNNLGAEMVAPMIARSIKDVLYGK